MASPPTSREAVTTHMNESTTNTTGDYREYQPLGIWLGEERGLLKIPQPPSFASGTLWHYTTAAGLLAILKSDRLWASSAAMLNDSSEIEYGISLLQERWERFAKESHAYDKDVL